MLEFCIWVYYLFKEFINMRRLFIIFYLFFLAAVGWSKDAEKQIVLKGIYQGENIYVMNPFAPMGMGFCVLEVRVNDQITTDEINSSAFEIDLSIYNFKIGDSVEIIIKHRSGCKPKVLNPEVILPRPTFNIESIKIDPKQSRLIWITSQELGSLPFIVEQYKWNKWSKIGTVKGKGTPDLHSYSYPINFHSGLNRFRVRQIDNFTKRSRFSPVITYMSKKPSVIFKPGNGRHVVDKIIFSEPTSYEIYDYYGRLKKRGYGKEVDVRNLSKGSYFLNYDNKTAIFYKK